MVDCSKCKVGSWYWIKYALSTNGKSPGEWIPVKRLDDRWLGSVGGYYYMHDISVLEIGPEIGPPKDTRKPGIYRVKRAGIWGAAQFAGRLGWIAAGSREWLDESSFDIIGDYLGPAEPPSDN